MTHLLISNSMDSVARPMRTLSSLPTLGLDALGVPGDLWIEIAVRLDPLDVLILSETCQTLYCLLTEKSVWIRILRATMRPLGFFIPSYSLSSMSVRELQRAAAGPYLWRRVGERGLSHTDSLSSGSVITKSLRTWEISVNEVKLVPGGRFAVTRTTEQSPETGEAFPRTITLWDLGLPGVTRQAPMQRVADYALRSGLIYRADGRGFKVFVPGESLVRVVFSSSLSPGYTRTVVLQIALDVPEPAFAELGHLDIPEDEPHSRVSVHLSGDHVLLFCSPVYHLWNYITQHYCLWSATDPEVPNGAVENVDGSHKIIGLRGRYIVALSRLSIRVWDTSRLDLLPPDNGRDPPTRHIPPHATLSSTLPSLPGPPMVLAVDIPESSPPDTVLFDLFHFTWRGHTQGKAVIRYELTIAPIELDGYRLSLEPLAAGRLPSVHYVTDGELFPGLTFEFDRENPFQGGRTYLYEPIDTAFPRLTPEALQDAGEPSLLRLVYLSMGAPASSCPFSGRILYHSRIGTPTNEPILCADYL